MAAAGAGPDPLGLKFRQLNYSTDRVSQKRSEVTDDGVQAQAQRSNKLWKRINPGYVHEEMTGTTNQAQQQYDAEDFKTNKSNFRMRDRHTEYVEYLVRDQVLGRGKKE